MTLRLDQHPLSVGFRLLEGSGQSGQYCWEAGRTRYEHAIAKAEKAGVLESTSCIAMSCAERIEDVRASVNRLRLKARGSEHDGLEPAALSDTKTFVQHPLLLNKIGSVWL